MNSGFHTFEQHCPICYPLPRTSSIDVYRLVDLIGSAVVGECDV